MTRRNAGLNVLGSSTRVLAKAFSQPNGLAPVENATTMSGVARISSSQVANESSFRRAPPVGRRARIWDFMENHPILNTFIFLVITLSATTDMLETEFRHLDDDAPVNLTFVVIDYVAVGIFTIEFAVRIFSCPSLSRFVCSLMNWVDLLAILPSYIGYVVNSSVNGDSGVLEVSAWPMGSPTFSFRNPANGLTLMPSVP